MKKIKSKSNLAFCLGVLILCVGCRSIYNGVVEQNDFVNFKIENVEIGYYKTKKIEYSDSEVNTLFNDDSEWLELKMNNGFNKDSVIIYLGEEIVFDGSLTTNKSTGHSFAYRIRKNKIPLLLTILLPEKEIVTELLIDSRFAYINLNRVMLNKDDYIWTAIYSNYISLE
jgi:hypothetical protein